MGVYVTDMPELEMYSNFVSKSGKESFKNIMAALQRGEIPTPAQLNEFFKIETIADTPRGDFAKNGKEIIRGIAKNLGNNPAKINELNLVLHAAYFQDVELVARLASLNGVNVNIAGVSKEGKIRGATAIGIASSIIGSNESEVIFELLADKLLSDKKPGEKVNVGDWIAWGIGADKDASGAIDTRKQEEQIVKTTNRLNSLSTDFTLKQDEVLRLMAKVTELNPPEIPEKYKTVDRSKLVPTEREDLEKIEKARESFIESIEKFRKVVMSKLEITDELSRDENNFLSTRIEMLRYQHVESEIPSYKLKLAIQCVSLMDQEFNVNEDAGGLSKNGVEFFHRLKKLQSAVTALDPTVRAEFRKFIKNPDGHIFEKLIEVVADSAKLAEFSKELASNPTLYKLYQDEAKKHSHLKPLLDAVEEGVNKELEKAGVGTKTLRTVKGFFEKKATSNDLEKLLGYSPIRPDDFVQVPTRREEVKAFMQKCLDTGLVTKKDLPNYGVISTTATEKDYEAFVKASIKAVAYKWQGEQTEALNKGGKFDDLTEGFVTRYIKLTEELETMNLRGM